MYNNIKSPIDGKIFSITSKRGKSLLEKYYSCLIGGSQIFSRLTPLSEKARNAATAASRLAGDAGMAFSAASSGISSAASTSYQAARDGAKRTKEKVSGKVEEVGVARDLMSPYLNNRDKTGEVYHDLIQLQTIIRDNLYQTLKAKYEQGSLIDQLIKSGEYQLRPKIILYLKKKLSENSSLTYWDFIWEYYPMDAIILMSLGPKFLFNQQVQEKQATAQKKKNIEQQVEPDVYDPISQTSAYLDLDPFSPSPQNLPPPLSPGMRG